MLILVVTIVLTLFMIRYVGPMAGPLTDTDLAMIPGDAYTGVEIDRGITLLGELTLNNVKGLGGIAGLFSTTVVQVVCFPRSLGVFWFQAFVRGPT